jgi:fused signal recognition particle receptor
MFWQISNYTMGLFSKLFSKKLDQVSVDELTDIMVSADISPDVATEIVGKIRSSGNPTETLRQILLGYSDKLVGTNCIKNTKETILIVGVNGAGKTTTIGKLAKQMSDSGRDVVIGACDTFRAAATEQLDVWAKRANAKIIHGKEPSSVAYNTVLENTDVAILDTAGRLHNRTDLMDELSKVVRVIKKVDENAPTETWLVLDGTTGQNALNQIEFFDKAVGLTGLVVTKMDGTSKAGFLISYAAHSKNPLPVRYIGFGEKVSDLMNFDSKKYVDTLIDN